MFKFISVLLLLTIIFSPLSYATEKIKPSVQLAMKYHQAINVKDYFISEKYDGIRAIWNGKVLKTRDGNKIYAPDWFTAKLPDMWLDGELWSARGEFEFISSTVRKKQADFNWHKIKYMVFDAPDKNTPFYLRYQNYKKQIKNLALKHVVAVKQFEISTNEGLNHILDGYVAKGAEGLILHYKKAIFRSGRGNNLIKLKPFMDAEATVIAHLPGKGKFQGMLGSLLVKTDLGIEFRIGSGFSDLERVNPPKIGDVITFSYHGLTKNKVPKFASYMRVRTPKDTKY
ncbi:MULTISPECIES: DNA ligase [unclassified Pseudoalteromonas]|uniref:DNA ligase n=1 Tax=unclassified Pseudoalteromonas TaxID=194690 RepID=UPI000693FCBF|nr:MULTISPECIES: DNA ligase [unclassified Pseudoalteromonas]